MIRFIFGTCALKHFSANHLFLKLCKKRKHVLTLVTVYSASALLCVADVFTVTGSGGPLKITGVQFGGFRLVVTVAMLLADTPQ